MSTKIFLSEPKSVSLATAQKIYGLLDALSPEVRDCEKIYGEYHKWSPLLIEGVGTIQICGRCYVRRCDAGVLDPGSRCVWPVHHSRAHRDTQGRWREVGGGYGSRDRQAW